MVKDLHIRDVDDKIHSSLSKAADQIGVSVNSIVKDAIDKWLKQQSQIPKSHDIILYSSDASMAKLLKSIDRLVSEGDMFRSFCAPSSNKITKLLSRMNWYDGTVTPYTLDQKKMSKYCAQTMEKIAKGAGGKQVCCFDFVINDIAKTSLKEALLIEEAYDKNRIPGLMFCPYRIDSLKLDFNEFIEMLHKHDQIFLLTDSKLYKLHLTDESIHKLLLKS